MKQELHCITCHCCRNALESSSEDPLDRKLCCLIEAKGAGKLKVPSNSVYQIVLQAEHFFQLIVGRKSIPPTDANIVNVIAIRVLRALDMISLFPTLSGSHLMEQNPLTEDLHNVQLIKSVVRRFLQVRVKSFPKIANDHFEKVAKMSAKNRRTKVSHFSNE